MNSWNVLLNEGSEEDEEKGEGKSEIWIDCDMTCEAKHAFTHLTDSTGVPVKQQQPLGSWYFFLTSPFL